MLAAVAVGHKVQGRLVVVAQVVALMEVQMTQLRLVLLPIQVVVAVAVVVTQAAVKAAQVVQEL
jgi:hypothetical protein